MGLLGYNVGGFLMVWALGYIALGILWTIPPLRRNKRAWYFTAAGVAWLPVFLSTSIFPIGHICGAAAFTALAWWRSRVMPAPSHRPPA